MKKLKKALICSLFSMMFCTSMFVGSTYAWFTDEVVVPTNQIVAGNLDVELYAKNSEGNYQTVGSETKLFKENTYWEPGHLEVVNLKVSNVGTLALKYQLSIDARNEKSGINVDGNPFNLSDYIMFAAIDGDQTYETRDDALTAAKAATPTKLGELNYTNEATLLPGDTTNPTSKYVTIVVYMPGEEVGNVANYRGEAPTIDLGVKLVATQASHEEDSFGPSYDSNATYPNA